MKRWLIMPFAIAALALAASLVASAQDFEDQNDEWWDNEVEDSDWGDDESTRDPFDDDWTSESDWSEDFGDVNWENDSWGDTRADTNRRDEAVRGRDWRDDARQGDTRDYRRERMRDDDRSFDDWESDNQSGQSYRDFDVSIDDNDIDSFNEWYGEEDFSNTSPNTNPNI